jgi:hypothetical protein
MAPPAMRRVMGKEELSGRNWLLQGIVPCIFFTRRPDTEAHSFFRNATYTLPVKKPAIGTISHSNLITESSVLLLSIV